MNALDPATFESLDFKEADIEEWIIQTPSILDEELLVVSSQYKRFDRTDEMPDVLALDPNGELWSSS